MAVFELSLSPPESDSSRQSILSGPIGSEAAVRHVLWFIKLRWFVIGVFFTVELAAGTIAPALRNHGIEVPSGWPGLLALILAIANTCFRIHAHKLTPKPYSRSSIHLNIWSQIIIDLLTLTVVVHYLGSLTTFICFAYLFHTVLACIFFPPRWSLAVAFLACFLYVGCIGAELSGIIAPAGIYTQHIDQSLRAELLISPVRLSLHVGSALGIFMVVWYLASNLSSAVRQRDRQLLSANQRLLAADRERTQHMLHTTHELKAPFAAIQSYVQLLAKGYCGPLSDDAQDVLSKIDARSHRLSNQIREMLQLANLRSAAAANPTGQQVDLAKLLNRAIASCKPQAQARDISFQTDLHQAYVNGVHEQLEMMLTNLVANAVQYSYPAGQVRVSCGLCEDGFASVKIIDQGIGIRPDALSRIFDEYYRSKEAAQHNPMCTGLGLAIVKHIARTHNIAIRVDSQLKQGTTFTLTFPLPGKLRHHRRHHLERPTKH